MKYLMLLLLPILLSSCASVPMGSLEADAQAKEFKVPAGKSRIYLYRNESFGGGVKVTVTLDGQMKGQTASNVFYAWDVEPGNHQISCLAESNGMVSLNTKPNKSYYVWQEMKMGMWSGGCALHEVDEATGRKAVSTCKLAHSY